MKRHLIALIAVLTILAGLSAREPAKAHPHAWIDLTSLVVLDETGAIVALEQLWLFDDFYSNFILSHIDAKGGDRETELRETVAGILGELRPYGYYTKFRADHSEIGFETVVDFETEVMEDRIALRFRLPLSTPVDPTRQNVRYAVFDPTYYVEMQHMDGSPPQIAGTAGQACRTVVIEPEATPEQTAYAASLGPEESGGNTLGAIFAQWIHLSC